MSGRITVAWAVPAAAATVGERHHGAVGPRHDQVVVEVGLAHSDRHLSGVGIHGTSLLPATFGCAHTPDGYVSAGSPSSHRAVRSSGCSAPVSSMWMTASNWSA